MTSVTPLPASAEEADTLLETGGEAPPAPAPEGAPAPSPAPEEAAQPRDEQGRFTAQPASPEPSPAPADGSLTAPATEQPPATSAPEPEEPWSITADGQPFTIEGSDRGEDGVFIPTAKVPEVERLLQEGIAWRGSAQRYLQQLNERSQTLQQERESQKARAEAAEAQLSHILGHFEKLIESSLGQPLEQSPIGQWLMDAQTSWPVLKAQAEAQAVRLQHEADRQALASIRAQQEEAQLRPQMDQTLSQYVLHYGQQAGLDRPALEDIYTYLRSPQFQHVVFYRAKQDDPLQGISKGDLVVDHGLIEQEVQRVAKWAKPASPAKPAPAAPVKKPTPPPTVSAAQGPSPRKPAPTPRTREEADRMLEEGGYDLE
jgi:hypothetical protein